MPSSTANWAPTLVFPFEWHGGPDFYLSLFVLAVGVAACVYFLMEWLRHAGRPFFLYWSFGFLALYWFEIPAILSNAGVGFSLSDFNMFYAVSFPLSFLGILALYAGIRSARKMQPVYGTRHYFFASSWIIAAFLFLLSYIAVGSTVSTHLLASLVVFLFFVPAQILVLVALLHWNRYLPPELTAWARAGIATMAAGMCLGLFQTFLVFYRILSYSPAFWFVAVANYRLVFILQAASGLLLVAGFLLVHLGYAAIRRADAAAEAASRRGSEAGIVPSDSLPKLALAIVIPELVGVLSSLVAVPSIPTWYADLNLPSVTPPGWVFSSVWITLFFLMGIAAYLVWRRGLAAPRVKVALLAFVVQLVLNVMWTVIFFGAHLLFLAFVENLVLWGAIVWTVYASARVSRAAAWLLAPYLVWVTFAAFLTGAVWRLNQ